MAGTPIELLNMRLGMFILFNFEVQLTLIYTVNLQYRKWKVPKFSAKFTSLV